MTSIQQMIAIGAAQRGPCPVAGCTRMKRNVARYCASHQNNLVRYGHAEGKPIPKKAYQQEHREVLRFIEDNASHKAVLAAVGFFADWLREASKQDAQIGQQTFLKLFHHGITPWEILTEVMAVWLYSHRNPHQLPDDQRLTFCIARNVSRLAGFERVSYGKSDAQRHPKAPELRTVGTHIRGVLARLFINMNQALQAKQQQALNINLPFI